MAEYQVGRSGGKDRYMVGWNESKASKNAYKVGGTDATGQMGSKSLPGDQDAVVGSKSQFSHADKDTKDDGSESVNMGFGGQISSGAPMKANGAGGEIDLAYTEKGDWSDAKNAIAKRKAQMESYRQAARESEYETPTVNMVNISK